MPSKLLKTILEDLDNESEKDLLWLNKLKMAFLTYSTTFYFVES